MVKKNNSQQLGSKTKSIGSSKWENESSNTLEKGAIKNGEITAHQPSQLPADTILTNKEILARVPKGEGNVVYEVSPQVALKKEFLKEAKDSILSDISNLSNDAKKTLKYLESRGVGCKTAEICIKGFLYKQGGAGYADKINKSIKELESINIVTKDKGDKREMANKCIIRKVKVKSYWKFESIIPKYVRAHTRDICIPKKRIALRKKILLSL